MAKKKHRFTWEERTARCRGELQQVKEAPNRFADTTKQLTTHSFDTHSSAVRKDPVLIFCKDILKYAQGKKNTTR